MFGFLAYIYTRVFSAMHSSVFSNSLVCGGRVLDESRAILYSLTRIEKSV